MQVNFRAFPLRRLQVIRIEIQILPAEVQNGGRAKRAPPTAGRLGCFYRFHGDPGKRVSKARAVVDLFRRPEHASQVSCAFIAPFASYSH